jgi:hypothetical protein
MNIKITTTQHNHLCSIKYKEYTFGSHLHGINNEESDKDILRVIGDDFYSNFDSLGVYLPNIHPFQYDDKDHHIQYLWMTERQFYSGLFSGDANLVADIVLLSNEFDDPLFLCRNYKVIKGYIGFAKRDLKLHPKNAKKRFHALRSLRFAQELMDNMLPNTEIVIELKSLPIPSTEALLSLEKELREKLNYMLDHDEITLYPNFKEENNELGNLMLACNNLKQFKYD